MSEASEQGEIFLICARSRNGAIGRDGKLCWHIPEDLRRFKRLTMGLSMIMGRKTFESLPGILPGRRHIVLTRDPRWSAPGAERAGSVGEALMLARREAEGLAARDIAVIGGAQIYALFHDLAQRVELTQIHADYEGDCHLPPFDAGQWELTAREDHPASGAIPAYSFLTLRRAARTSDAAHGDAMGTAA